MCTQVGHFDYFYNSTSTKHNASLQKYFERVQRLKLAQMKVSAVKEKEE